jgi:hypothetical protein
VTSLALANRQPSNPFCCPSVSVFISVQPFGHIEGFRAGSRVRNAIDRGPAASFTLRIHQAEAHPAVDPPRSQATSTVTSPECPGSFRRHRVSR